MTRSTRSLMTTTAKSLKKLGTFGRDWGVPFLILLVIALADGLVRTVALIALLLVIASKVLLIASAKVQKLAPSGVAARAARRGGAAR